MILRIKKALAKAWLGSPTGHLISFPKAGRTWVRYMLGLTLMRRYAIETDDPTNLVKMRMQSRAVPFIEVSHADNPHRKTASEIAIEHDRYKSSRIVFLVRDPRDVMVSWYHHATYRERSNDSPVSDFIRRDVGGLDSFIKFHNLWAGYLDRNRDRVLLIRYEDMRRDATSGLAMMLDHYGITGVSESDLHEVVQQSAFESMKRKSEQGLLRSRRLAGASNGGAKIRSGKVGGFADVLGAEDISFLNRRLDADLVEKFGYNFTE